MHLETSAPDWTMSRSLMQTRRLPGTPKDVIDTMNIVYRRTLSVNVYVAVGSALLVATLATNAATVISPFVTLPAPGFGSSVPLELPGRYQQVFQASDFLEAMPQGGLISALAFRVDEFDRTLKVGNISSIQLNLSTSRQVVNGLSPVFGDNIGPDEKVVFGPTGASLFGLPGEFAFVFSFQTPFLFDPRAGNLLLDVRNYSGAVAPLPQDPIVDTIQEATLSRTISLDVNATTGALIDAVGAVVQFTFTPIPEPSPFKFGVGGAFVGLGGLAFKRLRKRPP